MLSESEMKNVFSKVGISEKDAERIFKAADSNKDGVIQAPLGPCGNNARVLLSPANVRLSGG